MSGAAGEATQVNTYRLKHGEDGSLKCLYGFTLDREPIQSQQKYCMQPVHVILLQPSSFWQGKETRNSNNKILPCQSSGLAVDDTSPQVASANNCTSPLLCYNTRIFFTIQVN